MDAPILEPEPHTPHPSPETPPAPAGSALANGELAEAAAPFRRLIQDVGTVVVGQETLIETMVLALLADGHLLIEGVPGLAKTTAVAALSEALGVGFQRLQFTPDLLPADLVGTQIYRPQDGTFTVEKGPLFSNLILADEINRAPAKVQSALLEAMQERQVTLGGQTFDLPRPFLVMATQNPIEQEGTYPLPEAQLDRFMMKASVGYPSREQELLILERMARLGPRPRVTAQLTAGAIDQARRCIDGVRLDPALRGYIVDLVQATRRPESVGLPEAVVQTGASPRATLALALAAKAVAFLRGRSYTMPDDIKRVAPEVLRHRLVLGFEAEAEGLEGDDVVARVLDRTPLP